MEMQQDRCEFYVELKILKLSPSETFNITILASFESREFHFSQIVFMLIFEKGHVYIWSAVYMVGYFIKCIPYTNTVKEGQKLLKFITSVCLWGTLWLRIPLTVPKLLFFPGAENCPKKV